MKKVLNRDSGVMPWGIKRATKKVCEREREGNCTITDQFTVKHNP